MASNCKPVRRAFVFGAGGVLGFAWIVGALTAIQHELGLEPGARRPGHRKLRWFDHRRAARLRPRRGQHWPPPDRHAAAGGSPDQLELRL